MIQKFLNIRWIQVKRSLQDLTVFHVIALLIILFFAGIYVLSFIQKNPNSAPIIFGIALIGITILHLKRPDKRLINIVARRPLSIFGSEYLLLTFPFFLILIYLKVYLFSFLLISITMCIALINKDLGENEGVSIFSKYIPVNAFEWRAGMRKQGIIISVFYLLALAFSWVRVAPIIFLFFGLAAISQFFVECEPLSILLLSRDTTPIFLRKKITQSLRIYAIFTLPILLLSMIFVPDLWYVSPIFFVVACFNIANFILTKYAFYHPNFNVGAGSIVSQLSLLGSIIPFLLPLPFFLVIWNYFKAKQKLNYFLSS